MSPQPRGALGDARVHRTNGRGIVLPEPLRPFGRYVPAVRTGNLVFLSGAGPVRPDGTIVTGRVGAGPDDMSLADARAAARLTGLRLLAALRAEIGDLDRVGRVVKLLGFVRCTPDFTEQPAVIDGCSELLVEALGEAGRGARSAVGVAALPFGIPVGSRPSCRSRGDHVALSVAVVGGGIGGLTAAVALLRSGHDVRVYEQAHTLPATGAGIQLAPNCTRVLGRLGLLPALSRVAVRPTAFEFRRWDDGRVLSQTPLGDSVEAAYGAPYLHAHRNDLAAVLVEAVPADRIDVGRRCVDVVHGDERAEVVFADGSRVVADVVVGADGIHSMVRQALFGAERARFTGHVAYRGLVPAERIAHLGLERRCTVRLGPGAHFVHYFVAAGRLVNLVCVAEAQAWRRESWTDRADVAEVRAAFGGWDPLVEALIGCLDLPLKWALFDRDPLPSWGRGVVTLLGDACHPMLPYGAQGYAQAVEDAGVLAACLADPPDGGIPAALDRYAVLRRERVSRVQAISRGNGVRFHLPDGPEQQARDAAMASSFGLAPEIDWLYGYDPLPSIAVTVPLD